MNLENLGYFSEPPKSVDVRNSVRVGADDTDDALKSDARALRLGVEDSGRVVSKVCNLRERDLNVHHVLPSRSGTDVPVKDENLVRLHLLPPRPHFEVWSSKSESFVFSARHYLYRVIDLRLDALKSLEPPPLRRVRHDSNVRHAKRIRLHGRETKEGDVTGPRI